jgi:pyruvate/2-oxoglutarate dehydrogenase complex dihydrolipoamide acyltransferase (E2) component
VQTSLQDLKDAVLTNPTLALDALRYALQQAAGAGPAGTAPSRSGVFGDLPLDTPIFKMLAPEQAKLLTPNAAKLVKEDLFDLAGIGPVKKTPHDLHLSFDDLKSMQDAFNAQFVVDIPAGLQANGGGGISHCCCTPCCCCTAVSVPDAYRRVA